MAPGEGFEVCPELESAYMIVNTSKRRDQLDQNFFFVAARVELPQKFELEIIELDT